MLAYKVMILVVLTSASGEGSRSHHYYVTTNNSSDCPPFSHCQTLSKYTQQHDNIFVSNTIVEFLSGLHEMNSTGLITHSEMRFVLCAATDSTYRGTQVHIHYLWYG